MLLCLRLLSTHLSLALAGGVAGSVLGGQARPLRNLLFRLMDTNTPQSVQEVGHIDFIITTYKQGCHYVTDP